MTRAAPPVARRGPLSARLKPLRRLSTRAADDDVPDGLVYCRALDLYVDPQTKARAEMVHFTEAHHALRR